MIGKNKKRTSQSSKQLLFQ